ncbi:DNA gyrase subunit A [Dongia mobilis]|uniref:DNA gyrase subunit A n=1 Tax=Dongia mobilis TaxID=578943 RepID=A0A4R6WNU7_9PROT|nr:DNA gyrase subunit A [Dongia mobilis]TDQ80574.1 DNA gyrase subunit A [Dongia mobilis]
MTETPATPGFDIAPITIEEEMKRSYLDYAMSVIVSRALPDVRDGLKPVHRRILYAMSEGGFSSSGGFKKSARAVGDVMAKYHPHGDQAIYDALVRMAQDFSLRVLLIDGQGNFGSMDGDPAAAMRYTESRLSKAAEALLEDIDKETVDFQPNYDDRELEPVVLPARFPNLLVNGAGGIAVGMATNIPTHNLSEVIDACCAYVENPEISIDELIRIVPGPDFPTGGVILGRNGIREAYHLGKGSVVMRGRTAIEEIRKDREAIVITEVPYQVNKARMIERMAECVREKIIEGIADLRDESDRDGVRVVVELKRDAMADVVLNQLYRFTPLQTSFGVNMLALNGGKPEMLNLKSVIAAFVAFREEVITRRTVYELGKARERAHVLVGLAIAVANIDEVIQAIRTAPDPQVAKERLMGRDWPAADVAPLIRLIDDPLHPLTEELTYRLSEAQAKAILDLRLQRLTGLEREKIAEELNGLAGEITDHLETLESRPKRLKILTDELIAVKAQFGSPRRTSIEENEFEHDIEDLIQREDMVVTVTHGGYIKRVPLSTYRAQRRGGKGRAGMSTRDEDFVAKLFVADTHTPVLFFSTKGMVYKTKVYRLPLGNPQARGKALVNILPLSEGETISTVLPLPEDESTWHDSHIMFATASGYVRRNELSDFVDVRANGKIAMKLDEGDRLIGVAVCTAENDILLAARSGKAIRFPVTDVRVFAGRDSVGVRGIRLEAGDHVVSMTTLNHIEVDTEERDAYLRLAAQKRRELAAASGEEGELAESSPEAEEVTAPGAEMSPERFAELEAKDELILTVTAKGYGKRTSAYEYRLTGRGGQGVANIEMSARNGHVVTSFTVTDDDQIMLVTDGGQLIRCPVHDIRVARRQTQGVKVFTVAEDEQVVAVAHMPDMMDEGEDTEAEGGETVAEPDPAGTGDAGAGDGAEGAPE